MLEVKNLVKVYSTKGGVTVRALDDVSVKFPETGMVFLLGRSGSGKSTLLNVAGGLDRPDSGEVIVKGRSSKNFSGSDFDSYRNTCVGFVFQEYNILNEFTIEQNISLALQLQNKKNDKAAVNALLEQVDLKGLGKRKPNTLSGGQKQRVAIARALIKEPEIIMADEPTGALDSNTGKQVFDTLKKLSATKLVIVVSHDRDFAEYYADRIIELKDGKIIEDVTKTYSAPKNISENVQMVSDDTVTIKNAQNITETDVKNIVAMLKKNGGEAVITAGKRDIKDVKRACKINDDGSKESFAETGYVDVKEYDGKKTKFIKSRLPASHAFKIGASGLKTKPVRLIFTILLSVVAFVMFGVVSAFMLYDKSYSISSALQEANYPAAKITSQYNVKYQYIMVDLESGAETVDYSYDSSMDTKFAKTDIDELNKNTVGLNFAGVFGLNDWDSNVPMIEASSENSDYYPVTNFSGFTDCGEAFMTKNGFTLTSGKYPTANDEIAVSNYVDALYKAKGKGSALKSEISYNGKTFKIVGVYNVGEIPQKYDSLKTESTTSSSKAEKEERKSLLSSYKDMLESGFYTVAFVADGFYDANVSKSNSYSYGNGISAAYVDGVRIDSYEITESINENYGYSVYTDRLVKNNKNSFKFYDLNGNEIKNIDKENLALGEKDAYAPIKNEEQDMMILENLSQMFNFETNKVNNAVSQIIYSMSQRFVYVAHIIYQNAEQSKFPIDGISYVDYCNAYSSYNVNEDYEDNTRYYDIIKRVMAHYDELVDTSTYPMPSMNYSYVNGNSDNTSLAYKYYNSQNYNEKENEYDDGSFAQYIVMAKNAIEKDYASITGNEKPIINYSYVKACEDALFYEYLVQYQQYYETPSASVMAEIKTAVSQDYESITGNKFTTESASNNWCFKNYENLSGTFNIKGYYEITGKSYGGNCLIVSEAFVKKYSSSTEYSFQTNTTKYDMPSDLKYSSAITLTQNTQEQIAFMIEENAEKDLIRNIDNNVYNGLSMFIGLIEEMQTVFLIVGAVVGALAALMLLNFISTSISAKRKEIGILRAVGARGSDVFKIFFAEAFIIAMICFVLSAIGAGFVCNIINSSISGLEMVQTAALLDYGLMNVGLIFVISMVISAIATFFPVLSASKKPPVESIRAL